MTIKHTPGPWAYQENADPHTHIVRSVQPRHFICQLPKSSAGISEANARLIAAAPDMLALLRELIDIEGPQPGTSDWANKVKGAIAKATGCTYQEDFLAQEISNDRGRR